jgi:Fe2+ transport system protein FeoA
MQMTDRAPMPLALMRPGEGGVLTEIRGLRHLTDGDGRRGGMRPRSRRRSRHLGDPGHRLEHRLNYMGLVPGEAVTVMQNSAKGPLVIAVKGSRLCLARGIAFKLLVTPTTDNRDR